MTIRKKIDWLRSFEAKLTNVAKYILVISSCFILAAILSHFFIFTFTDHSYLAFSAIVWILVFLVVSIVLLATVDIFVKYAISFESFVIKDRKLGFDNLFPALLGTFLLFPVFLGLLMPFLGVGNERPKARDARRISDMRQLFSAQEMYYETYGRYFTCGQGGGDCQGSVINYPEKIDIYLTNTPSDPRGSASPYKGIDNSGDQAHFCYYATLENKNKTAVGCGNGCGFYTATELGNFYVVEMPISFKGCSNLAQNSAVNGK